jgi:hypothetical protein
MEGAGGVAMNFRMKRPDECDLILAFLAILLALIIGLELVARGQLMPPMPAVSAPIRTNYTHIAATAYDSVGLESPYSAELVLTNWSLPTVPLAWDVVTNVAGYRLYWGTNSRQYTHMVDVGNVTNYTLVLVQPITNVYVVRPQVSTNLTDWRTNGASWLFTNITTTGDMFWRLQITTN